LFFIAAVISGIAIRNPSVAEPLTAEPVSDGVAAAVP